MQQQPQGPPHPTQPMMSQPQMPPSGGLLPHPHQHHPHQHPQQQQFAPPPGFHPPQQPPHHSPHMHPQQQFQQPPPMHFMQQQQPQQIQRSPQHMPQPPPQQLPPGFQPMHAPPPPQTQQQQQQPEHDPFLQHVVSASLVDLLGKQILVLLRDGRKLIGDLLSFDQYSNIVVSGANERKVIGNKYFDEPLGLYVIRGENIVLIGDQQPSRLSRHSPPIEFTSVTQAEFAALEAAEIAKNGGASKTTRANAVRGEDDDLM